MLLRASHRSVAVPKRQRKERTMGVLGRLFGWGKEEHTLKTLMKAKGLSQGRVNALSDELRHAYERSKGEPRYQVQLGKKKVLVTPSPTLERELVKIIHE